MKLTNSILKQLIQEELRAVLSEGPRPAGPRAFSHWSVDALLRALVPPHVGDASDDLRQLKQLIIKAKQGEARALPALKRLVKVHKNKKGDFFNILRRGEMKAQSSANRRRASKKSPKGNLARPRELDTIRKNFQNPPPKKVPGAFKARLQTLVKRLPFVGKLLALGTFMYAADKAYVLGGFKEVAKVAAEFSLVLAPVVGDVAPFVEMFAASDAAASIQKRYSQPGPLPHIKAGGM